MYTSTSINESGTSWRGVRLSPANGGDLAHVSRHRVTPTTEFPVRKEVDNEGLRLRVRESVAHRANLSGGPRVNPTKFENCLRETVLYLEDRRDVKSVLLYGSVAVGTAGPESDLDLLIVSPRDSHEELALELYRIGARYDVTVSPYLVEPTELESLDPQFLESVLRDGVVLKGKPLEPSLRALQLEPYQLVTLQLGRLSQREKVGLSRDLYGYRS